MIWPFRSKQEDAPSWMFDAVPLFDRAVLDLEWYYRDRPEKRQISGHGVMRRARSLYRDNVLEATGVWPYPSLVSLPERPLW